MSIPQVGQGAFAVVPTFKGFRKAVTAESDASAKAADTGFRKAFAKTGTESGKQTGAGFKKAFEGQSTGFADRATRELERAVSSSAKAVSAARLKEQDAAGKVRVAEAQLAEAREKFASDSSQVVRAQERLATAARQLDDAQDKTKASTNDLRSAQQNLASAADRTGDQLDEAGRKSARRFSSGFSEVFKGSFLGSALGNLASNLTSRLGYAIGAGIRNGFEFALGTIDIASDLNESVNAVSVSYGPIADAIFALGKDSAKTFGLSKRDLNSYAVQFSAFSKSIAGEGGDVAGTFKSILGRATDFASVMNLEVSEALGLFQSGLAGETEPLRRYGIDLSAAAVNSFAYANGIAEAGDELTEAQKQQARYRYLLEQTSGVQGDFANTSDELANKNRQNAATWDDVQASIGQGFLPIASALATVLSDTVFPAISELVDEYGPSIGTMFEDLTPAFKGFVEDVLPKLPELFETIAEVAPEIIDFAGEVIPVLVDTFGKFANGAQQISDFFDDTGAKFDNGARQWGDFFGAAGTWISDVIGRFENGGQQIADFFGAIGQWFIDVEVGIDRWGVESEAAIADFFVGIGGSFANGAQQIGGFFTSIGDGFANGAAQIGAFAGTVSTKVEDVIGFIGSIPPRIGEFFTGAGTWLIDSGKALIQGFIDGIDDMFGPVGDAVGGILDFVGGFFPNSPAKRGPFSGAGWTKLGKSGSAVMEQFTSGMARADLTGRLSASLVSAVPAGSAAGSTTSSRTVNQYVTIAHPDPRIAVRQMAREAEGAFASS